MKSRSSEVSGWRLNAVPGVSLGCLGGGALSLLYVVLICNEYSYLKEYSLRAVTAIHGRA